MSEKFMPSIFEEERKQKNDQKLLIRLLTEIGEGHEINARIPDKGLHPPVIRDHLPWLPKDYELSTVKARKIILTSNKQNIELLQPYKATVKLIECPDGLGELHVIITGKKFRWAKELFDQLVAMNPEEIYGDNK